MKVYCVGGAVRDELLGLNPKDRDYVVVGATPQEMLDAGYKQVGADFPVFLHPATNEEYALARVERKTGVGYGGFVTETNGVTLEEDLSRRDLTINAMAMDEAGVLIDPFGGARDLQEKVLRHVGPAFSEDPLRVIRLGRFYARYTDFYIAGETGDLAVDLIRSGALNQLSKERFWTELQKAFNDDRPDRFFKFLSLTCCFHYVDFFKDIFGTVDDARIMRACDIVFCCRSPEERMLNFVALMAKPDAKWSVASTKLMTLHKNVQLLRACDGSTDSVFQLLKQAKAWGVGEQVSNLISAMVLAKMMGEKFNVPVSALSAAHANTCLIKASMFPELSGKELGEQIDASRKCAITSCLNLYKDA